MDVVPCTQSAQQLRSCAADIRGDMGLTLCVAHNTRGAPPLTDSSTKDSSARGQVQVTRPAEDRTDVEPTRREATSSARGQCARRGAFPFGRPGTVICRPVNSLNQVSVLVGGNYPHLGAYGVDNTL